MKLKVGYVPFPTAPHVRRLAENVVAAHNAAHRWDRFAPEVIVSGPAALARVSRVQQLYIFGLGRPSHPILFGDNDQTIDVVSLARQLRAEGLTPAIRTVKVWASHSGLGGSSSLAAQLKAALLAEGFSGVVVHGYLKALGDFARDGHKVAADVDAAGAVVATYTAKAVRVRF